MSLKEFYSGKVVLLTGGTGYIGRLLLAKLLSLGNLREVLLLSRPKKGKSNDERLDLILKGILFEMVSKSDPNFRQKIRVVNADMEAEGLGISGEDREYIKNNAQIIIHGAATVKFDEPLRTAIAINVRGTKNMLDLAREVKDLQSFVHISTAYSHCPRKNIAEEFYESPLDYRRLLSILKFDDDIVNALTGKLIAPWPNTYVFTKAVTEDMIRQFSGELPIAIIRPTIGEF
jgi:alcohol-forming fatty acyl-CoA reductase